MVLFRLAALLCFLAVALGAFGAHALKGLLQAHDTLDIWNKAVFYHFIHAVALLALGLNVSTNRGACFFLLAGIAIFGGSLYLLALTNARSLGAITPIGGLCFLIGWGWLFLTAVR